MEAGRFSEPQINVATVLSDAWALYRRQATALWTTIATVVVPAQILIWVIVRVSLSSNAVARNGTVYTAGSTAGPTIAVIALGFLSAILGMGALSRLLVETYTGHPTSWQESLRYAGRHLASLLWLGIVSGILLGIAYVLLIVPGIFLTVAWAVAVPALVFEGPGVIGSLNRSWELVRGHWWSTFGALVVALVITVGIGFLVGAILSGAASSSSVAVVLTLSGLSRAISAILSYPLIAAISVVLYAKLRAQKEGVSPEGLMPGRTAA